MSALNLCHSTCITVLEHSTIVSQYLNIVLLHHSTCTTVLIQSCYPQACPIGGACPSSDITEVCSRVQCALHVCVCVCRVVSTALGRPSQLRHSGGILRTLTNQPLANQPCAAGSFRPRLHSGTFAVLTNKTRFSLSTFVLLRCQLSVHCMGVVHHQRIIL